MSRQLEDAQQPEKPHEAEINADKRRQIEGLNQSGVTMEPHAWLDGSGLWLFDGHPDPEPVFRREDENGQRFEGIKEFRVGPPDGFDRFENDGADIQGDQQHQPDIDDPVERVAVSRRLEDGVEPRPRAAGTVGG